MTDRTGLLLLCGVPIGDPADASPRLREALAAADVVAAEDTRRLRRLAARLEVPLAGRVVSYYDAVETARSRDLLGALEGGATVVVVTDAGMPGVSDPGYRLVSAAVAAGVRVSVVPGPSAVTAALAVSGLPSDRWVFEGFLPRRSGERRRRLLELAGERRTLVLLEAPHRVAAALTDLAGCFGAGRRAALCRELTKTWEEVVHDTLGGLAERFADGARGEITLVVAGAGDGRAGGDGGAGAEHVEPVDLAAAVAVREAGGMPRKEAIADVVRATGRRRREVYDAVVRARTGGADGGTPPTG